VLPVSNSHLPNHLKDIRVVVSILTIFTADGSPILAHWSGIDALLAIATIESLCGPSLPLIPSLLPNVVVIWVNGCLRFHNGNMNSFFFLRGDARMQVQSRDLSESVFEPMLLTIGEALEMIDTVVVLRFILAT
jgi:hypothetical protein